MFFILSVWEPGTVGSGSWRLLSCQNFRPLWAKVLAEGKAAIDTKHMGEEAQKARARLGPTIDKLKELMQEKEVDGKQVKVLLHLPLIEDAKLLDEVAELAKIGLVEGAEVLQKSSESELQTIGKDLRALLDDVESLLSEGGEETLKAVMDGLDKLWLEGSSAELAFSAVEPLVAHHSRVRTARPFQMLRALLLLLFGQVDFSMVWCGAKAKLLRLTG